MLLLTLAARIHYTSVLVGKMLLRDQLKDIKHAEDAAAAEKRPRRGTTVSSLGKHHFSTQQDLHAAVAATMGRMLKGKGRAVDLSVQPDRPPSG